MAETVYLQDLVTSKCEEVLVHNDVVGLQSAVILATRGRFSRNGVMYEPMDRSAAVKVRTTN